MQRVRGWLRRFRFPWRSALDIRRDVEDELQFHLTLRAAEHERRGLSPGEARRESLREFGDLERARNELAAAGRRGERARRLRAAIESFLRDVRYALRALGRSPGFAVAATLVLAFGVGSSVVVFSMLDTLVLRPLPLREPARLFRIGTQPPHDAQWTMQPVNLAVVDQWRADSQSLERVAGFVSRSFTWRGPDGPERIAGGAVVGDLFPLLGATMTVGRAFTAAETDDAPAILSNTFWRRRFGARPDVLGRSIELDGVAHTIVGVLPPETGLPVLGAERVVWVPASLAGVARESVSVAVVGRLRRGVARDAAAAELATIQRNVIRRKGLTWKASGVVLQSMQEKRSALVGPTLFALFGGSLVLLAIACANVATLSLTRLVERRHDLAVRSSLGASRWNLARQVVAEHVVLWWLGGGIGIGFAAIALRAVLRADPFPAEQVPASGAMHAMHVDARVAFFGFAITLGTALLFGLLAARQSWNADPVTVLRQDGATVSASRTTKRWRQLLVVSQVALSTVLAAGACLLALSAFELTSQPLGFRPDGLLTFHLQLPARDYPDQPSRLQFQRALLTRLRALPGVGAAATTSVLPLGSIPVFPSTLLAVEGQESDTERPWPGIQAIDESYLGTAGTPILSGRGFDETDGANSERVVIVNETFARTYFPGQNAVGKRVAIRSDGSRPWLRMVGVVADVKHAGLDWKYLPELFIPYRQIPDSLGPVVGADIYAVLRVPDELAPSQRVLRALVSGIDRNLPLMEMQSGDRIIAASAKPAQFRAMIMGGVAVLAVLLSGVGLFALLRQSVAQRRKEFGIRLALGAAPSALLEGVCRSGIGLAAIGIGLGVVATFALARYVRALLFGVSAIDPAVLGSVVVFMLAVAVAAAALPAWRATKLSPTLAIRNE